MSFYNVISFAGLFVLVGIGWLFSADRKVINWRVLLWGLGLQIIFAYFVFANPAGTRLFLWLNEAVVKLLDVSSAGAKFVFGLLAVPPGQTDEFGHHSLGFFLIFQGLPTIIFFSALISLLYYFGIMPLIIKGFARVFTKFMRISGAEAVVVSSNIFAGVESALTIRPYLEKLTRSELCTLLTAGMATVSSNIMALYVFSLKEHFPGIAGHLISASILSAPAAILMSKIVVPEKEAPATLGTDIQIHYEKEKTVFEAVINGANAGVKMIVGIVALLIAVIGLVALCDLMLKGMHSQWSLKIILGYVFYPFTLFMGVPYDDAMIISNIIGERAVLTEVVAYQDLARALAQNALTHPRSAVIAAYALCGFAHVASLAIFVGGTAAIASKQTHNLAKVGVRALVAATLACLLTGAVAGIFATDSSLLFRLK